MRRPTKEELDAFGASYIGREVSSQAHVRVRVGVCVGYAVGQRGHGVWLTVEEQAGDPATAFTVYKGWSKR